MRGEGGRSAAGQYRCTPVVGGRKVHQQSGAGGRGAGGEGEKEKVGEWGGWGGEVRRGSPHHVEPVPRAPPAAV